MTDFLKMQKLSWLRSCNTSCDDHQAKTSVTELFSSFACFFPTNNEITLACLANIDEL